MRRVTNGSSIYKLDLFCSDVENFLNYGAAIPILGTIPGLLQVVFGAVQFTAAVTTLAISSVFNFTSIGQEVFFHSLRHIAHGLINILSGALRAIPLIGTLIFGIQVFHQITHSDSSERYKNNESNKFFGYRTVRNNTWTNYESIPTEDSDLPGDATILDVMCAAF